jgi:hypothetical protein
MRACRRCQWCTNQLFNFLLLFFFHRGNNVAWTPTQRERVFSISPIFQQRTYSSHAYVSYMFSIDMTLYYQKSESKKLHTKKMTPTCRELPTTPSTEYRRAAMPATMGLGFHSQQMNRVTMWHSSLGVYCVRTCHILMYE